MKRKSKKDRGYHYWCKLFFLTVGFLLLGKNIVWAEEIDLPGGKIQGITAVSSWNKIEISWKKNEYLSETENLILVRKKEICPENIFDGEEVYRGNGSFFEDKKVEKGEKYCYGVGIVNLSGSPSVFKVSQPAMSLNFKESLSAKLTNRVNLIILIEMGVLLAVIFVGKMRKKFAIKKKLLNEKRVVG